MSTPEIYEQYDISPSDGGYFRHCTVGRRQVIFVSEDDLWTVPCAGGTARRLTATKGRVSCPAVAPDGRFVAYTSTEQGCPEVFVMPVDGGEAEQLTFSGAKDAEVCGWSPDGESVIFRSNLGQPFQKKLALYRVPRQGGQWEEMGLGRGYGLCFEPDGPGRLVVRNTDDLAWWKRYRGGRAGRFWIDVDGNGHWQPLLPDETAGMCRPMWIGERIYFVSDRDGTGNIYSCSPEGDDLCRHTCHEGFYARFAAHFDKTIVYVRAGRLIRLDVADDTVEEIDVDYPSSRTALKKKYVDADEYLEDYALHPEGHSLAVTCRGKVFNFGNWEGAVRQTGVRHGVRYRLARYLDDRRLVVVSDNTGEEHFEIHDIKGGNVEVIESDDTDIGSPADMAVSFDGDRVLFTNHRFEVWLLDLEDGAFRMVDDRSNDPVAGIAWAPDSRHVAYAVYDTMHTSMITVCDLEDHTRFDVTEGQFQDIQPTFDPDGRYLYFLSYRKFTPVADQMYRDMSFPKGCVPCAVTLRRDVDSPFVETPRPLGNGGGEDDGDETDDFAIDFDGLRQRIELFPVDEGNYDDIAATDDRVYWSSFPPDTRAAIGGNDDRGTLEYFDLEEQKCETFAKKVATFSMDRQRETIACLGDDTLRVVSAGGDGPDGDKTRPGRQSGIVDFGRLSVAVDPRSEWCQMLREAWRLMRDNFWRADMGGVDWDEIWDRYKQLLPQVSARVEFSDLVWMMQGELGTSHAYEWGGDFEIPPQYQPGFLGADVVWDEDWGDEKAFEDSGGALRIERIPRGDSWDRDKSSPLLRPGVRVSEGDGIVAIDGQRVTERTSISELLVRKAGREVELLVADADTKQRHSVTVEALRDEMPLRYRDWVERNRTAVHEATDGRVGYVHIPDMMLRGYAEFHRQFRAEYRRSALIVDARFNGGGFVSALVLEKLARQPVGYSLSRHRRRNYSYPMEAARGPMVALTNGVAGSDGDIFSHCFKQMDLGPLIGTRTWGGTIGIWPRRQLVDGSYTSQPEFAFWLEGTGFGLENHGATPDIEVAFPPGAEDDDADPQLRRGIEVAMDALEEAEILEPPSK